MSVRQASSDSGSWRSRGGRSALLLLGLALVAVGGAGCSNYKKLSWGGSPTEVLMYDVLGRSRPTQDYYQLVRSSHKDCDFCYRCGDDEFLVDKNVDALQRLGCAPYGRLEGQAQVVELLAEVLLEDCSALARSSAAGSLTKMGLKMPRYPGAGVEDDGSRLLRAMKELDGMHDACGRLRGDSPGARQRVAQLVTGIGEYDFPDYLTTKNAVRLFYSRPYILNATDPTLRQAIDTALVKRLDALIRRALAAAVEDPTPAVRADAMRGLKTLADRAAAEAVVQRLEIESDWLVKIEGVEYLGRVGTRDGVRRLVVMLDDANASVRHKARQALVRVAGRDYGFRPEAWKHWAKGLDPTMEFEDRTADQGDESGLGPLGP